MFTHQFKYSFRTLLRNKMLIFWTFAFPIIMGLFFFLAFKDIEKNEILDIIDIAVVNNEAFQSDEMMQEAIKNLSEEGENQLFHTTYVSKKEAEDLLDQKMITGYVVLEEDAAKVIVKESSVESTVLKFAIDEMMQMGVEMEAIVTSLVNDNPPTSTSDMNHYYETIYHKAQEMISHANVNIKDTSKNNMSYTMIEYYTLIAMTCLYGGILGMSTMNSILANMSAQGRRVSVSPNQKGSMILASLLASYVTQLIGLALLFVFLCFVIHVDFGSHFGYIVLLSMAGSLAGLSLGVSCATLMKTNENTKTGMMIAITMFGCFLSGMMGITMKYIVDKNIPILNKMNPASMITDGFYALYYYDVSSRYWWNIASLIIFSLILIGCACVVLRRQKYDNI